MKERRGGEGRERERERHGENEKRQRARERNRQGGTKRGFRGGRAGSVEIQSWTRGVNKQVVNTLCGPGHPYGVGSGALALTPSKKMK